MHRCIVWPERAVWSIAFLLPYEKSKTITVDHVQLDGSGRNDLLGHLILRTSFSILIDKFIVTKATTVCVLCEVITSWRLLIDEIAQFSHSINDKLI